MEQIQTIEQIPIDSLIAYANNSRTHSDSQIAKISASIREFGFTNPVLIDGEFGIIAGHGRVVAARDVGIKFVPCIRLGYLTPAQKRAYIIADNKIGLDSGWDNELLGAELAELTELGFDLSFTGFNLDELSCLLAPVAGLIDPDEAPPLPDSPRTVPGDVWVLGQHRLLCGDAANANDLYKLTGGQLVDIWLTDPPYNVAYEGRTREKNTIENDNIPNDKFRQFLCSAYTAADAALRPGAVFYIWHGDREGYNFRGAAVDIGWVIRQTLIWKKSSIVFGRSDYQWIHESCLYGWKRGSAHQWSADRKQTTILEFDRPARNREHPTIKPVALFEYQILNSTRAGDVVLDSFGGSGTALIAAEKTGRVARLIELDPKYCDVIVTRWQNFTGRIATHAETGKYFSEVKNGNEKN